MGPNPICQTCDQTRGVRIPMKGPVKHPQDKTPTLFFVCERCNSTLRDRRIAPRGARRDS